MKKKITKAKTSITVEVRQTRTSSRRDAVPVTRPLLYQRDLSKVGAGWTQPARKAKEMQRCKPSWIKCTNPMKGSLKDFEFLRRTMIQFTSTEYFQFLERSETACSERFHISDNFV